jgi:hypothetical protein
MWGLAQMGKHPAEAGKQFLILGRMRGLATPGQPARERSEGRLLFKFRARYGCNDL